MPQTPTTARRLVQHIRLKAPAARVYKALTNAEELMKWFPTRAVTDPKVGGNWRFEFEKDDQVHLAEGRYLELIPDRLVRYSWMSTLDDEGTSLSNLTVTIRLEAHGDETDLYLEETGYGEGSLHDEMFGERTKGWGFLLGNLEVVLAGGPDAR